MIIRLYAGFGAIFFIIIGCAWLSNGGIFEHNTINGVISLVVGVFGLIYIFIKSMRRVNKKKEVSKNAT